MRPFSKIIFLGSILLSTTLGFSQEVLKQEQLENEYENVRSFRIGVKTGIPNLLSGNIEYVLPILNRKFAVSVDYSKIKLDSEDIGLEPEEDGEMVEQNFSYIEGGINYYIFNPGKGIYTGLSYTKYSFKGLVPDYAENENGAVGDAHIDENYNSLNLKLGAKWGGLFYFRTEAGYAFNPFPSSIPMRIEYEDGTTENQNLDFPADNSFLNAIFNGLIFNIGIGFSF